MAHARIVRCVHFGLWLNRGMVASISAFAERLGDVNGHPYENRTMQSSIATLPRGFAQWCVYLLILLAPGSFLILPLVWIVRRYARSAVGGGDPAAAGFRCMPGKRPGTGPGGPA